jgi:hypothetical protein
MSSKMKKILNTCILFVCFALGVFAQSLHLLGDANGDTKIDMVDALIVAQCY